MAGRQLGRSESLVYREHRVKGMRGLVNHMRSIDEDEGIRVEGRLPVDGRRVYLFINCYRGKYWVTVCDRIRARESRKFVAGSDQELHSFDDFDSAWRFVRPLIKLPLKAWLY